MNSITRNLKPLLKKILVVEDSIDFQFLLQHLFANEGYEVDCASNGKEAFDKLQSQSTLPNLILLDLMMPVMDGFEFRRLQELDPRLALIPVIIMTAHGDAQIENKKKLRVTDYIKKPIDMESLLETTKKICFG